jgi:hypothetical protein
LSRHQRREVHIGMSCKLDLALRMSKRKERLTVVVDPERRLMALAQAVDAYEAQCGVISVQELADQARADRDSAVLLRGSRVGRTKRKE